MSACRAKACLVTGDLTDTGYRDLAGLLPGNHDDRAALLRHCPPMQRNAGASCRGPVELGQEWLLLLHQPRHLHLHLHLQLEF